MDLGTAKDFYGPNAPQLEDLEDTMRDKQRWTVDVLLQDGQRLTSTKAMHAVISHPDFGLFRYGQDVSGLYDTVHWLDKGGSNIILYTLLEECLYIGLILQERPAQVRGKMVYEVPRGFRDANEDPITTARRELLEEVGLPIDEDSIIPIGVGNPNNTFILGCPMKYFAVELHSDWLESFDGMKRLRLMHGILKDDVSLKSQRLKERIASTELIPFAEVAHFVESDPWLMGSMPMLSAITLLTFHLNRKGIRWN